MGWTARGRAECRVRPWQRPRSGSALMLRHPMTGTAAERALGAAACNVAGNSRGTLVAKLIANCASRISERSRCAEGNRAACLVHRDDHASPVSLIAGTTGQVNGDVGGGGPVDPAGRLTGANGHQGSGGNAVVKSLELINSPGRRAVVHPLHRLIGVQRYRVW